MIPIDPAEVRELSRLYDSGVLTTREAVLSNKLAVPLARLALAAGKKFNDIADWGPNGRCIACGTATAVHADDCWAWAMYKLAEGT